MGVSSTIGNKPTHSEWKCATASRCFGPLSNGGPGAEPPARVKAVPAWASHSLLALPDMLEKVRVPRRPRRGRSFPWVTPCHSAKWEGSSRVWGRDVTFCLDVLPEGHKGLSAQLSCVRKELLGEMGRWNLGEGQGPT